MKERLDGHDRKLLMILANNPEWTYEQIAEHMGITSRSVGYRIERLRNLKVIQKAHLIYYDRLGDMIYSVVLRFKAGVSSSEQEKTIWEFKDNPHVIQVFSALGAFSLIVLFHAESPKDADKILRDVFINKTCFESFDISQITDIYSIYRNYI
jgi:DNA-binding Lrp family transcriptional regulator